MENSGKVKLYTTQSDNCPILSVRSSPWRCTYDLSAVSAGKSTAVTVNELERIFSVGYAVKEEYGFSLVGRYCSAVISGYTDQSLTFEEASDKLVNITRFCRKHHRIQSHLPEKWLCGLYLSCGRQTHVPILLDKGMTNIPFAEDYTAGAFINAFISKNDTGMKADMFTALAYLSDFDCKRSPAYPADEEKYEKVLFAVLKKVLAAITAERGRSFLIPTARTVRTQCFQGLLCPRYCERELEITYIPYSENSELSAFIGACIRHLDNLMRQGHGIRSKLVGFTLSPEYRKLVADTIREELPGFLPVPMKVGRKPKEKTDREKAADKHEEIPAPEPIDLNIDFAKAKKLEAESWKLAAMLGADYGVTDISFNVAEKVQESVKEETSLKASTIIPISEAPALTDVSEEWQEFFEALTEDEKKLLCIISTGRASSDFAKKRGGMLMGFVDSINEKASDAYGDIILSCNGAKAVFIEDYEQELTDIFKDMYNTEVL